MVTLISVPLVIGQLGAEQYGVYVGLAALVNILLAVDLGLGSALVNEIAEVVEPERSRDRIAVLVTSAVYPLVVLVAIAATLLFGFTSIVDVSSLLGSPPGFDRSELQRLLLLAFVPYLLSLPLGIVVRVRYGLQEGHRSHLFQVAGYALQVVVLLVAAAAGAGLSWYVVLLGAGALFGYLFDALALVLSRPWITPRPSRFVRADARRLLGTGSLFLVLGVSAAIGYQTDALVISHFLGASGAATYGASFQLIAVCPLALSLFLNPLWPAYREAIASGDETWVRRSFFRSLATSLPVAAVAGVLLIAAGPELIRAWAGPDVVPPTALMVTGALFVLVAAVSGPMAMMLNGLGILRSQAVAATCMAALNIVLSIRWVQQFGIGGPLLATSVTQVCCILLPMAIVLRARLRAGLLPAPS